MPLPYQLSPLDVVSLDLGAPWDVVSLELGRDGGQDQVLAELAQ